MCAQGTLDLLLRNPDWPQKVFETKMEGKAIKILNEWKLIKYGHNAVFSEKRETQARTTGGGSSEEYYVGGPQKLRVFLYSSAPSSKDIK